MSHPDLWIATIPPAVLARPTPVEALLVSGFIETRCPLCGVWLTPQTPICPWCRLALDWSRYRSRRRAAWNAVKDWLLDRITYEEPPASEEAVEAGYALLEQAYEAIEDAEPLLESYGDKPLCWLLKRWNWLRRNQ